MSKLKFIKITTTKEKKSSKKKKMKYSSVFKRLSRK